MQRNAIWKLYVSWIAAGIPIIIYFLTVNHYSVNLPYADDFDAILHFLTQYKNTSGGWNKFLLLFSQHNEHRILPSRIVYLVCYKVAGTINFRVLIFIANFQLLVIYAVIFSFFKQYLQQYWRVIPFVIGVILFDLNAYENADWAMAGMQNYGVVMFFLLSLYFYNKSGKYHLLFALLMQFFCAFSSGNGMIGGLVLMLFNLLNGNRYKFAASICMFLVSTGLYFIHFHSPQVGHGAPFIKVILFFLHSIGVNFGYKLGVPGAIFLLVACTYFFPVKRGWRFENHALPLIAILTFILISLAVTAYFRAGISMEVSYSTRYFIYPHIFVCIVFVLMINGIKNEKLLRWAIAGSLFILLSIYTVSYQYGTAGFARIRQCIYDWNCYTDGSQPLKKQILSDACKEGIFCASLPAAPR